MPSTTTEKAPPLSPSDPIAELIRDHRILLSVADALERYATKLVGNNADQSALIRFCVFFREFGTVLHHEKEEHIAMAAMSLHGFKPGGAPRAQLHDEHRKEHSLLLKIFRYALSPAPLTQGEKTEVARQINVYCTGLRQHLAHEEEQLYPAMANTLSPEEMASVARKLRRFDEEHNESGQFDWLIEQAESLEQAYREN